MISLENLTEELNICGVIELEIEVTTDKPKTLNRLTVEEIHP
jgi:hypothetical protein